MTQHTTMGWAVFFTPHHILCLRAIAKPDRFRDGVNTIVAVDTVGAGEGELVMFCQGSSARQAGGLKQIPVDAAVVAIVDSVDVLGKKVYGKSSS